MAVKKSVSNKSGFNISSEDKNKMLKEIQYFFENERDEEIGIIAAEEVLDFFIENMGKNFYNKGLDDARAWTSKRIEDLEIDYESLYRK